MKRKMVLALVLAGAAGMSACDSSPTDATRPQYDVHTRPTTTTSSTSTSTTTTTTTTTTTAPTQPGIGEPCDPATYSGPYRCILKDESNADSGYVVAY